MARITVLYGWRRAFVALAITCLLTAIVALVLAISQRREAQVRLKDLALIELGSAKG
jgi:predicted MFS family arabinose efflux permease